MIEQYKHIVIEGNIGAGKTTAARSIAADLNARLILEEFDNNPFLTNFYRDKERYAFQVELHFLAERYQQLSRNLLGDIFQEHTVYDYFFIKSQIFSTINLIEDERILFNSLYQIMERFMPKPDILFYIHCDTDVLLRQITNRGRTFEANIQPEYLNAITTKYLSFFKECRSFPVVLINTEGVLNVSKEMIKSTITDALSRNWSNGLSQISL